MAFRSTERATRRTGRQKYAILALKSRNVPVCQFVSMMNGLPRQPRYARLRKWSSPRAAGKVMLMRWQQRFSCNTHSMRRLETRAALIAASVFLVACSGEPHGAPVRVIVPRGASFGQAADSLGRAGIIGSAKLFTLYGRLTNGDRNIKPGTYLLKHGTPWTDIVSALNGGHGLVNTVTIPEGWTISQITPALAKTLRVPVDSVAAAVRDTAMLARLDIPNPTL